MREWNGGYCKAQPRLYEHILSERKNSPSSRLFGARTFFNERVGWNATVYSLLLNTKRGVRPTEVVAQTLSMMVVE